MLHRALGIAALVFFRPGYARSGVLTSRVCSPGRSAFFLIAFLVVFIPPAFVVFIIAEGVGAVAPRQPGHASLTAHVGETFDTVTFGILHQVQLIIEKVVVFEWHGTLFMHHQRDRTMHTADPIGQILCIAYCSREADQPHVGWRTDDGLLPHRTTADIAEVVHFVDDDVANIGHRRGDDLLATHKAISALFQQPIAVDLGGHDADGSTAMFYNIARHQPNGIEPIEGTQIAIFLV